MESEKPSETATSSRIDSARQCPDEGARKEARLGDSFMNLVKALPDIVYVLDSLGHFVYLNDAVRSLGYEPEELLGRHFTDIIHKEDRLSVSREAVLARIRAQSFFPETPPKLFDERRSGQRMTRELEVRLLRGKTGEIVYVSVNAYGEPVTEPTLHAMFKTEGTVTMGVIHDITAARLYQKSLEENLASKEILLKEVHHRVRDNLQVIASLAHLREMEVGEESAKRSLSELIAQIKSIALIHEALYQTEDARGVSAKDYFERFAQLIAQTYGYVGSPVSLVVEADDHLLDAGLLSYLAMVASELVSNAYRHAFPDGRAGTIRLGFAWYADRVELAVSDDGIGPPLDLDAASGLGMEIVEALTRQLGGRLEKNFDSGVSVKLIIPERSISS